jgi:hypothetical protein
MQQMAAPGAAQAAIARHMAQTSTEQAASRALLWGLLSPIFVCLPFPSVLAVMAFSRAQRAARAGGVELPTRARVGLALGGVSGLGFVAAFIAVCISVHNDSVRVDARKSELAEVVARHGNSPVLDHELACALAEISLLNDGFAGQTDTGSFRDLECAGALHVVKERAELDDFKLRTSSTAAAATATICLKHGDRWFVERTGVTSCELAR